jgi:hypothetical protein
MPRCAATDLSRASSEALNAAGVEKDRGMIRS